MRTKLKEIGNENRCVFTGVFERLGWKSGFRGDIQTVLLTDIKDSDGNIIADHLWFNYTKGFQSANLSEGDVVQFNARVAKYEKGYKGFREDVYCPIQTDYKLSFPTKVQNLGKQPK